MSVHAGSNNGQAAGNQTGAPQNDQQQGQQQNPAPPQGGEQGPQQGGGSLGLLNGEAGAQQASQDNGNEAGNQSQGGQQTGQQTGAQQPPAIDYDRIGSVVESIVDRRINDRLAARMAEGSQQQSGGTGQQGQQQQQGSGQSGNQQQQHTPSGPTTQDLREARSLYREFVTDQITFLGAEEREHALSMANGIISTRLARGEDPETAGRVAAEEVAKSIKGLRDLYEGRTIGALRQKGLLKEDVAPGVVPGRQPLPGPASGQTSAGSNWQAGASKSQELFPGRFPQQAQQ